MSRILKDAYTRNRVITDIDPERRTRAVQSERHNSDINNIVARAHRTGQLPVLVGRKHIEALPDASTYQEMLDKVVYAQQQFERLPSKIRAEFGNRPENMLNAVSLAQNGDENIAKQLREIGVLIPAVESPPPSPKPSSKSSIEPSTELSKAE